MDNVTSGKTMRQIRRAERIFSNCRATTAGQARPFFFFFSLHPAPKTSRIVENKKLNATRGKAFFSGREDNESEIWKTEAGALTEQKSEWIDTCRTHVQPGVEKNQGTRYNWYMTRI